MGRGRKKTVSFFFLFSAPALLAIRGSPLTARSFARRSFDRSKNARKRKRLLAVYWKTYLHTRRQKQFKILLPRGGMSPNVKRQPRGLGKRSQESVQASDLIDSNMAPVAEQKKEKDTATDKKEETKSKDETKKEEEKEMVNASFLVTCHRFCRYFRENEEIQIIPWLINFLALCQRQLFKNGSFMIFAEWGRQTIARGVNNACGKIVGKSLSDTEFLNFKNLSLMFHWLWLPHVTCAVPKKRRI